MYTAEDQIAYGNYINDFQVGAMVDAFSIGSIDATQLAIDSAVVRASVKALEFYDQFGVDSGLDVNDTERLKYNINEFGEAEFLDISAFIGTFSEGTLGDGGQIVTGTQPDTRKYTWTVTSDGQTIFTMPFDISEIHDVDDFILTLNGAADPTYGDDYTISGNLLTWSGVTLSAGWVFVLQYTV